MPASPSRVVHGPRIRATQLCLCKPLHTPVVRGTHDIAYRRLGMRTPPFQMQMPILVGTDTSLLLQLLHLPLPPRLLLLRASNWHAPYSAAHRGSSTRPRSSRSTPPRTRTHCAPHAPVHSAPSAQWEGARIGLDEATSHGSGSPSRSRWWWW